ncbi:hypothetical protein BH10PSE10_BH10PSE10_14460 [soil metagenome]
MPVETFEFVGASASRLFGMIEAPEAPPALLGAACPLLHMRQGQLSCGTHLASARPRGIGVLRFDFAGLGGSDGDFADATFSH